MYNFTFIKLTFFLIVGILLGFYIEISPIYLIGGGVVLLLLFIISFLQAKRKFLPNSIFGILVYAIFTMLGYFTAFIHIPENKPNHYINYLEIISEDSSPLITAEVVEQLKPSIYQDRYIVKVVNFNSQNVKGKLLLNISKENLSKQLKIGERIAVSGKFEDIQEKLNPYQFDYSRYMKNLGVIKQLNISSNKFQILENSSNSLRSFAGSLRNRIIVKLKQQDFEKDEMAVIQALLLGQRQELSKEIQANYASAGVIHILAVSGLHVGIILFMLNWLLKFLNRWKYGVVIKTLFLLALLWSFALLAGLSPSVVRAVSMFSFVAIGLQLKRRTSVLNTLFASLLILLLINPYYIFQVGFQLSYSAVFSIVIFQPYIASLFSAKNKISGYLWKIASVTIAAQIGVLPLSLFYFHQFPGLFILSNILILPFMGALLAMGFILIFMILIGLNPVLVSQFYGWCISLLNNFVNYIASLDVFVLKNIPFSLALCVGFYLLLIAVSFLLKKLSFRNVAFVLMSVLTIQLVFIYEKGENSTEEFIVFHKSRSTEVGLYDGEKFNYFTSNIQTIPSIINDYKIGKNIEGTKPSVLKNIYRFKEKDILLIDSLGFYSISNYSPKIILLTNSPKINLARLIIDLNPEIIVADGSNYKTMIARWKKTAHNKKIPFHITGEKGAFIINNSESLLKSTN